MAKRDYIRYDPDWAEKLEGRGYPDGAIVAFAKLLGAAEGQNPRGFFKNRVVLRGHLGRHARWINYLLDHGELISVGNSLYVEGWEEWQEGDWKVRERVSRIRNRKTRPGDVTVSTVTPVTVETVTGGTPDVTVETVSPPSDRVPCTVDRNRAPRARVREGKPLTGRAVELVQGYQALGYSQPSAADLVKAEEFVAELSVLSVAEMLARMGQHLEWCEQQHKPRPGTLGGFWNTLRSENDFRRDNGARPTAPRESPNGRMSRIGDVLSAVPVVDPDDE